MKLEKKIALITGGTGELGTALTKKFQKEGADIVVTYHSDVERQKFEKIFPNVLTLKADVSNESEVRTLFAAIVERKKGLDILCNIVGGYMPKKNISDLTDKEWDFMFSLNLKTCFLCTREALRIMQERKYGRVINVSAMAGLPPDAGRGAYGISKAAVASLTSIAAEEMKTIIDSDIRVNAIAPSILLTAANKQTASLEEMSSWVTLDRAADVITFLASDDSAAITGQTIKVYGRV